MNYETNDTYLSGYLVAMGMPVHSHHRQAGSTVFCFEQSDRLDELVTTNYSLNAVVNPQQYGSALRILKNLIYQDRNNNDDKPRMFNQSGKIS